MEYKDNLRSDRLITRFLTKGDAAAWLEYCSDPEATRYTSMAGKTPEELAEFWMERALTRYANGLFGLQGLYEKETGELVGHCGLITQEVNGQKEIEIGYHLLRRHWGKGYASEAAKLFRDYGFQNNVADSIVSIIHPLNIPSQRVALRNGMILVDAGADFRGEEYFLYRITKEEWLLLANDLS
jgi:ribosomal-protein-alanine N-acetyltransferase